MLQYVSDSPIYEAMYQAIGNSDKPIVGNTLGLVPTSKLDTTADCVAVINHVVGQGNWKRVAKKEFNRGYRSFPVRSFEDKNTNKVVSIQWHEPENYKDIGNAWVYDFDLRAVQNEIDQVADYCDTHYVCPDGGLVFYNPKSKQLVIMGSDSFFIYTDDRTKTSQVKIDAINYYEYEKDWMLDPKKHIDYTLTFLSEALYIDESTPNPAHGCIEIGQYKAFYDIGVSY